MASTLINPIPSETGLREVEFSPFDGGVENINIQSSSIDPINQNFNITQFEGARNLANSSSIYPDESSKKYILKNQISLPNKAGRSNEFEVLQKWEGVVIEVNKNSFKARLTDLTKGGLNEEAEIDFDSLDEEERELVKENAIFYWYVGYQKIYQRQRTSMIRFKRAPKLSKEEITNYLLDYSNFIDGNLNVD